MSDIQAKIDAANVTYDNMASSQGDGPVWRTSRDAVISSHMTSVELGGFVDKLSAIGDDVSGATDIIGLRNGIDQILETLREMKDVQEARSMPDEIPRLLAFEPALREKRALLQAAIQEARGEKGLGATNDGATELMKGAFDPGVIRGAIRGLEMGSESEQAKTLKLGWEENEMPRGKSKE